MKSINLFFAVFILSLTSANAQWQQTAGTPQGAGVTDMVVLSDGTLIVTTASFNWPSGQPGGIRRSTNGGNSWQNIMSNYNARTLHLGSSGRLFASCWNYPQNEGMFFSADNGINWVQTFFGAANDNVFSIAAKNGDSMVYVGTRNGVYRSFNNGAWIQLMSGMPVNSWVRDLAISPEGYIAAATTNGVFISTNHGNLWQAATGLQTGDTAVIVSFSTRPTDNNADELNVGTSNGKVYESDGSYTSFALSALFGVTLEVTFFGSTFALTGYEILALFPHTGSQQGGVAKTTNGGQNYTFINDGLPNPAPVSAASITAGSSDRFSTAVLYAGLFQNQNGGAKIYKRTDPIGIHQISTETPEGYSLSQNYPNPFNPATNIEFAIPISSFVRLVVYDMLGREVETLVNENLKAGKYIADWNAVKYSSGIYFYKLFTDNFSETKKMILNK